MSHQEILQASAAQLSRAILGGRVSSSRVVETYLAQIAQHNPNLNAVVQTCAVQARARALEADQALRRGDIWGVLHGVPFTVKDVIETQGVVSAAGLECRRDFVPKKDAITVARMKAAGGILLGKTNCPPGGGGGITDNPVYGATRNPCDPTRSPGGSSGGEATAIAARLSPVGIGSDSGGSLRVPAHFCGVATLKPTSGRVPSTGAYDHPGGLSDPRSQIGPMARFVEDLELVLAIISGEDGEDSAVVPMPLERTEEVQVHQLAMAWYGDDGLTPSSTETQQTLASAAQMLERAGVRVTCVRPEPLLDARLVTERYWSMGKGSGAEALETFAMWDRFRSDMLRFFAPYDVILCPVDSDAAPLLNSPHPDLFNYTLPYSLTGWPCVVIPVGTSRDGLPIGVQIIARPWKEHVALAVARLIEASRYV